MQKFGDDELRRAAARVMAEGRVSTRSRGRFGLLGVFTTDDRARWRTGSGDWTAELRRSRRRNHTYLALFEDGVYRGRYDATGWHAATDRKRVRQLRSYQLPLAA